MIADIVGQVVGEVLLYGTGKIVASVFMPHLRIEPLSKHPQPRVGWQGFTYLKGRHRYLHTQAVQLIGLVVWLVVGASVFASVKLTS